MCQIRDRMFNVTGSWKRACHHASLIVGWARSIKKIKRTNHTGRTGARWRRWAAPKCQPERYPACGRSIMGGHVGGGQVCHSDGVHG
jgi:hypothetical protein